MKDRWFDFEERGVDSISSYIDVLFNAYPHMWLFRGHADTAWALEPAIDRSEFSDCRKRISRQDHERDRKSVV